MIEIDAFADPRWTLAQWLVNITALINEHGEDAVMYTDGGHNNVDLRIEKEEPSWTDRCPTGPLQLHHIIVDKDGTTKTCEFCGMVQPS